MSRKRGTGAWRTRHAPRLNAMGLDGKPQPNSAGSRGQLPPAALTCAEGHAFKVQSRDGALVRCPRCWQEHGWATLVIVRRDGGT